VAEIPEGVEREPDVRYTLANERTFLAYERTAVGLLVAATAVLHLLTEDGGDTALGIVMLVTALVAALGGWWQYRRADRAMRFGKPLPTHRLPMMLVAGIIVCVLAVGFSAVR
jgi:putative membrane protein